MNELMTTDKGKAIPEQKLERMVFRLQGRIYRAACRGDLKTVKQLERLLAKSGAAQLLTEILGGVPVLFPMGENNEAGTLTNKSLGKKNTQYLRWDEQPRVVIPQVIPMIQDVMATQPQWGLKMDWQTRSPEWEPCRYQLAEQISEQGTLICCANEWILWHPQFKPIETCKLLVQGWWQESQGRELLPQLHLSHTLESYTLEKAGFEFLGFEIRHHRVGQHQQHSGTPGLKLMIQPSSQRVQQQSQQLAQVIHAHKAATQHHLIERLNPVIIAWGNDYRVGETGKTNRKLDYLLSLKLQRWARRRHPHKSNAWCTHRYWHRTDQGLCFIDASTGLQLCKHGEF